MLNLSLFEKNWITIISESRNFKVLKGPLKDSRKKKKKKRVTRIDK